MRQLYSTTKDADYYVILKYMQDGSSYMLVVYFMY